MSCSCDLLAVVICLQATTLAQTAAPVIIGVTPPVVFAPSGAPSGTVNLSVSGTGFVQGSTVNWKGSALATTFVSSTQLATQVPASMIVLSGAFNITVANPDGATSSPFPFRVEPWLSSINPMAFAV